ncbi:hypothetical protein KDK_46990 [Dictyobacter kobayashii]|uniref:Uncharacterized protein n=1 Tax=Dictyobacter kobayashii TaxID=2014872 RepID=A0A402APE2_9CHLR|nr:hypothetical protein KDK_46990 [Dictyobacter kobayashii]
MKSLVLAGMAQKKFNDIHQITYCIFIPLKVSFYNIDFFTFKYCSDRSRFVYRGSVGPLL